MSLFDDASLVLIPDGAKDSKLYSIKPTDGSGDFTFSRGSNLAATRVNENGLIEKGRENLLLYSEEFDSSLSATAIGGTATVTDNDAISPDGSLTAATLSGATDTNFGGNNGFKLFSASPNTLYTGSIYVRSDNTTDFQVAMRDDNSGIFTRETYTVTSEWQRVTVQRTKNSSSGTIRLYYGGTTADVEIWGAQAEVGSVATEYIQSTSTTGKAGVLEDLPRIDYSEGGCPSLLLEPQRTNFVRQSEYYNTYWNINDATIEDNSVSSPEGLINASKLIETATNARHRLGAGLITIPSTGVYVASVFLKKGTARYGFVGIGVASNSYTIVVDLEDGTITDTATSGTIAYQDVEDYGDGWYRCSVGGNITATSSFYVMQIGSAGSAQPTYNNYIPQFLGSTSNNLYVYGAQIEAGSYPTSYIPTNSAAVTRIADSCELTGVADLIGDSEGTLYFEGSVFDADGSGFGITLSDGTTNNRVYIGKNSSATPIRAIVNVGGVAQFDNTASNWIDNTTIKIALKYAANDFALWVNGVEVLSDLSGSTFSDGVLTRLGFDAPNVAPFFGNAKQLTVFPTALTDTELENLTS
jgi:hypothetical protein